MPTICPSRRSALRITQADALPLVSSNLRYDGHIRDLQNYYAAGCFVQYLIEMYGPEKFGELYGTGNYSSIYGKSLATLEAAWIANIEYANVEIPFDPADLIAAVDTVSSSYDVLFDDFEWHAGRDVGVRSLGCCANCAAGR